MPGQLITTDHQDYQDAIAFMEARQQAIIDGEADELIWHLEHPPLFTAGTSANESDLLSPDQFPVYKTGRGGEYTYHGPGQRVVYAMLDLNKRGKDVRAYVQNLEAWGIAALAQFGVEAQVREGRVGLWITKPDGSEHKIAAIGVRVRKWVTSHGMAFNIAPDLSHFGGIVPCGISMHGVTSLKDLGLEVSMADFDKALETSFAQVFGSD